MIGDVGDQALQVVKAMGADGALLIVFEQQENRLRVDRVYVSRLQIPSDRLAGLLADFARLIAEDGPTRVRRYSLDDGEM